MNKNSNRFFIIFLIGMFALLFLRTQIITAGLLGAQTKEECISMGGRWHCSTRSSKYCITPGVPCTQWDEKTTTKKYCCGADECGNCTNYCTREVKYKVCVDPNYRPSTSVACGEDVTTCSCTKYVAPTPCNRCLTKAPTQVAKSCQCLELKPKEDKVKKSLSFECLVKGSKDAKITDYTVTFKKPSGSLINLKSNKITETPCPQSVTQDSTCYQVETTAIAAPEKGKYEMVVPPLITCQ